MIISLDVNEEKQTLDFTFKSLSGKLTEKAFTFEDLPLGKLIQYLNFESKEHIQNLFPNLSADDAELFISGTGKEEWDEIFGEEDE